MFCPADRISALVRLRSALEILRRDYDHYRRAILCEPRGSDVLVGAFLVEPVDPACATGVIFFNNAGYLGMCGHGIIGVAATLAYQGHIRPAIISSKPRLGSSRFDLQADNQVTCRNVPAYRHQAGVTWMFPATAWFPATWPGAATGSSWSRTQLCTLSD